MRGPGTRPVLARGVGPTLAQLGVSGVLPAAQISLFDRTGIVGQNANWSASLDSAAIAAVSTRVGAFALPSGSQNAALLGTYEPGAYTLQITGTNDGTGMALGEVYDLEDPGSSPSLINLSARGSVGTGDAILISGFVVSGSSPKRLLLRAAGPALSVFGVSAPLAKPRLQLVDANHTVIAENAGWDQPPNDALAISAMAQAVGAFPFASGSGDAALIATLPPGTYTALVRGDNGATGVALSEIYDLDPAADGSAAPSGTLYLGALRPDASAAGSPASGLISLQLSADQKSAIISSSLANLSGTEISAYLRIGDTYLRGLPLGTFTGYVWTLSDVGNLSVADLLSALAVGQVQLVVATDTHPAGELRGTLAQANGVSTFVPPANAPATDPGFTGADAARLLLQATFGPTPDEITRAQSLGASAWIDDQLSRPATLELPYVQQRGIPDANQPSQARLEAWWQNAVTAPDQLRQRVAFGLSELFVVSDQNDLLWNQTAGLTNYYDTLLRDCFGNFRQLLEDVTLSPVMGTYLNVVRNRRPDPAIGIRPDENYAREVMQLFTIGLNRLNPDGTLQLDGNGLPIPTYDQSTVIGLAHAFTGWNFSTASPTADTFYATAWDMMHPMTLFPDFHDTAAKQILDGVTLPAGNTGTADLKAVLDEIFNHPNVGPFVARRLIQHLVTSSPSPGYVYRVARVFDDNGSGVRGDLGAVVRAILLDYEARSATAAQAPGHGKLREPLLRMTQLMRAFGAHAPNGRFQYWYALSFIGEAPLSAPNVFNFFDPDYSPSGPIANAGLVAPEFQIATETGVMKITNELFTLIFYTVGAPATDPSALIRLDFTPDLSLANDPGALVDRLNLLLMAGTMSADMRAIVVNAVSAIPVTDPLQRVRTAVYLIAASPEGAVQP